MIENGKSYSAIEHARASMARTRFYDHARVFFESCDLLITPQMPVGAWSVGIRAG